MKGLRKMLWDHFELVIIGTFFLVIYLQNAFWVMVLFPYGIITWAIIAQILYWWAGPRWNARFPRVTKSILKGKISELNRLVIQKNAIIEGYFKSIEYYQEEVKRLKKEIGTEKT